MSLRNLLVISLGVLFIAGCSSAPPKAEISSTASPQAEINTFSDDINLALGSHVDVLAPSDYKAAHKWYREAKEDLRSNESQKEILEDVRIGRGYLNRAVSRTEQLTPRVQGVLEARSAALDAGARDYSELRDSLNATDDELRFQSKFLGELSPEKFATLQNDYFNIELAAIQATQLSRARSMITGSIESGAKRLAPRTLKQAETDLFNAENVIAANRQVPKNYAPDVDRANSSATFLKNVVATIRGHKKVNESAAREMVRDEMQIANLKSELKGADAESLKMGRELKVRDRQLATAHMAITVQQAIVAAAKQFSGSDAEVFQQGDNLVVRLKSMNFSSGRAEIPPASLPLLAKATNVAVSLNPIRVIVEGHTDSTGSSAVNLALSQERAQAVATYLSHNGISQDKIESVGYGYKKPIATNKTPEGRAQNRRVDLIITPEILSRTAM